MANITPWSFLADMMGQGGGMCVPIVPCRLSQHIGGLGIARINDLGRVNRQPVWTLGPSCRMLAHRDRRCSKRECGREAAIDTRGNDPGRGLR